MKRNYHSSLISLEILGSTPRLRNQYHLFVVLMSKYQHSVNYKFMTKNKAHYRQGDVLIMATEKAPENKFKVEGKGVLAFGEVTGHSHQVAGRNKSAVTSWMDTDPKAGGLAMLAEKLSVKGSAPAEVTHEEHGTIPLPPGNYDVYRQQEYAPGELRNVAD